MLTYSQTFQKGTYTQNISLGVSHFIELGNQEQKSTTTFYQGNSWLKENLTKGSFLYNFEYGVSNTIGISMFTGVSMNRPFSIYNYTPFGSNREISEQFRYTQIAIPLGGTINYHFYDAIKRKKAKTNNLDMYIGADLGGGIGFYLVEKDKRNIVEPTFGSMGYIIFGGHFGIRQYFKSGNSAFFAEFGYGKSIVNVGFTFKGKHSK